MTDNQKQTDDFKEVQILEHPDAAGLYPSESHRVVSPPDNYYAQPAFVQGNTYNPNAVNQNIVYAPQAPPYAYPPNNYPPANQPRNNAPIIILAPAVSNNQTIELDGSHILLIKYSRWARYASLANFFLDLFIMVGVPFLFFIVLFNLLGYFGAKKFHKCMSVGFLVYLGIIILIKIIIMSILNYPWVIAIYMILILMEITIGGFFLIFTIKIFRAEPQKLEQLATYHSQQGNSGCCCFYI